MKGYVRTILLGALLALATVPAAAALRFHADYDRSEPAADAVLSEAPSQVKVWYTQELFRREGENWLHVFGPDGQRVDRDDTAVDDDDRTLLIVSLADGLADGEYRVEWRALSADDGHPKEDSFTFQLAAGNTPPPADAAATPVPEPTPSPAVEVDEDPAGEPTVIPSEEPTGEATAPVQSAGGGAPCLGASPLVMLALGIVVLRRRARPRA